MNPTLKLGAIGIGCLAAAGLVVGALAGWLGSLFQQDPTSIAGFSAKFYLSLIFLLPLMTWVVTLDDTQVALKRTHVSQGKQYLLWLGMTIIGTVLATLIFFVVATNLISIFKGLDAITVSDNLRTEVGWGNIGLVFVVSLINAAVVANWSVPKRGVSK